MTNTPKPQANGLDEITNKLKGDNMSNLSVWWFNKRFGFAYWLLGAKSMRVSKKKR